MKSTTRMISSILLLLIFWYLVTKALQYPLILPSPFKVLSICRQLVQDPVFLEAGVHTLIKVGLLLIILIPTGILGGFIIGLSPRLYDYLRPLILIIQAVPIISWLTLVIFIWGIGWQAPLFIAYISLVPVTILTTASGIQALDQQWLEVSKIYHIPRRNMWRYIYLGALKPFIRAILEINVGNAWKSIIVAEYLAGNKGIGVQIAWARQFVDVPRIYALTLLAIGLGILSERVIKWLMKKYPAL
jgi:NitT/TauT family transport system permease protein